MDYILEKIQQRSHVLQTTGATSKDIADLYRLKFEYSCVFLLGYLWNKNITLISEDKRSDIFNKIVRPTIGNIVDICQELDISGEFFNKKNRSKKILKEDYPALRNKRFGHGFLFEGQELNDVLEQFENWSQDIFEGRRSILAVPFNLVLVSRQLDNNYAGFRFAPDGNFYPWACSNEIGNFQLDNVYAVQNINTTNINDYLRLSPFIVIKSTPFAEQFYFFQSITEVMVGRARYNGVLIDETPEEEWPDDFVVDISNDGVRRKSRNNTILNNYTNNYTDYIDGIIGIKKQIKKFLLENTANVCAKIWGHGGVGKTAMAQRICDELSVSNTRAFDYIVFASAKNRFYDTVIDKTLDIEASITSYSDLLQCIHDSLGSSDEDEIVNFKGRLLLIIDDYETFKKADQEKIGQFISSLNINHHKVILTTRANVIIQGEEFPTHELSDEDTIKFLIEVMQRQYPTIQTEILDDETLKEKVFEVTGGRPLFIFQFAHWWARSGNINDVVTQDLKNRDDAIKFLYERVFDYLEEEGQILFRAIGILVTDSDLSNLNSKLRYIVNMETEEDRFKKGMEELIKLRVIETFPDADDFFRVYSAEILDRMKEQFERANPEWRNTISQRLRQVRRDKQFDIEQSLLENADEQRYSVSETEVVELYRAILNRSKSPQKIRSQAILNLTAYLSDYMGKKEAAIEVFTPYQDLFQDDPLVIKKFASCYWEIGRRGEAIMILMSLLERRNVNWVADTKFELRGLCLSYASREVVDLLDELVRQDREETDEKDSIKQKFARALERVGVPLFNSVKDRGVEGLSNNAKQYVITGLYHFSGACMRFDRHDIADEICRFGLQNSQSYKEPFNDRLNSLKRHRAEKQLNNSDRKNILKNLQTGQTVKGTVQSLTLYGAFVDLGGIHGLLHKKNIATWGTNKLVDPSKLVKVGDEIEVAVHSIRRDRAENRISLGLYHHYKKGQQLQGTVSRIENYGCFVKIKEGVEGLLHKSDMGRSSLNFNPNTVVSLNDKIKVEVAQIDPKNRLINFRMIQSRF